LCYFLMLRPVRASAPMAQCCWLHVGHVRPSTAWPGPTVRANARFNKLQSQHSVAAAIRGCRWMDGRCAVNSNAAAMPRLRRGMAAVRGGSTWMNSELPHNAHTWLVLPTWARRPRPSQCTVSLPTPRQYVVLEHLLPLPCLLIDSLSNYYCRHPLYTLNYFRSV
jgi:hypothetical protein